MKPKKYVIVYLIKGKAGKYNQKLIKIVGPKFNELHIVKNPRPPHITLKSPFEATKIKDVENILKEFVKKQKSVKININGFGNFRRFVAFLKVNFSKEAKKIQKNLIKELKNIKWMKFHEHDLKWKPHATIAYGSNKKNFNRIWDYLIKLNKPKFDLKFDNITLLIKKGNTWKVYKEFRIK